MRILEIEKYFQSEETLSKVLDEIKEDVEKIDYYIGLMKQGITINPEEAKMALHELTGIYMALMPIASIADTALENGELKKRNQLRIETEKLGNKYTTPVEAKQKIQARAEVSSYRRIKNMIQAYVRDCQGAISTLQSSLKYLSEEAKLRGRKE